MFYDFAEKVLELEKSGQKIIRLNIGDTNLSSPQCAIAAAINSLKNNKAGYVSNAGIRELREKIAERERCEIDNVVVSPGSKHLIYALLSVLCKKGDRLVFPSPHWAAYELISKQLGIDMNLIKTKLEDAWQITNHSIEDATALIICNPLNPTSTIYSEQSLNGLIEDANKKKVHVIIDEAYKGLAFKQIPAYDAIRVRSFSKEFNMEGWRLGYLVAPKDIAQKIIPYNQITTTCVPEFIQRAGIACLENEKEILENNRAIWKRRLQIVQKSLKKSGFNFAESQAGIYVFAGHSSIIDADKFALKLLEKGVAVASGSYFGDYKNFIRICPNQSDALLEQAMEKIIEAV